MSRYFVGVGAQKAGTTWLHDQLSLHPQVAVPPRKELHYFDSVEPVRSGLGFGRHHVEGVQRWVEQRRWGLAERGVEVLQMVVDGPRAYLDFLEREATEATKAVGEITPGYAILTEDGFASIRRVLSAPRVVFLMRDPVERYWSSLRFGYPDGDQARDAFLRNATDRSGHHARDDYAATVTALDRVFGDDVLYLFYEQLFTAESLGAVARHLGVDPVWEWDLGRRSNVGVSKDLPEVPDVVAERLAPQYRFVRERFGSKVPDSWRTL